MKTADNTLRNGSAFTLIERCIGWLKWCRRVVTRYEKLAESSLTMIKLAMIQRCNRLLEPSDRT